MLEVKDLFVGILGYVTVIDEGWKISKSDKYIIFRKKKFDSLDYYAENVFTNQAYFFFHGNTCLYNTVNKAANSYAVYKSIPLEHFIDEPKMQVSRNELLELYYKLNKNFLEDNETKMYNKVKDNILKMILQTSDVVKKSDIDLNLKQEIIYELDMLVKYYIETMVKILNKNDNELS